MSLDLSSLHKATQSLASAIAVATRAESDQQSTMDLLNTLKAGVIQNFEFTFELCWKMIQRWIQVNVSPEAAEPRTKKDLFRLAAKKRLIDDPQAWFKYHEARNITSHAYNEENAEMIYRLAIDFCSAAEKLRKTLEMSND